LSREPRVDLALDPEVVLGLLAELVELEAGDRWVACDLQLLKRTARRLVVLYELRGDSSHFAVVGKWFSTNRGAIVADELSALRRMGFAGPELAVPDLVAYVPAVRALFVEAVEGPLLRERLRTHSSATTRAGTWLAAFHGSALSSPRSCGPAKQMKAVARWASEEPVLEKLGAELQTALSSLADPGRPVHYDYYHSQVVTPAGGATTVLDLDEAGMGDPSFDVAHFEAHLDLLALQWFGDAAALSDATRSFRAGYESIAALPEVRPGLKAFAWFKLAHQLLRRRADRSEWGYAVGEVQRNLSAA
jgi:hypothetical protein